MIFKCDKKKHIDFYLCLSKEIDSPRIELQIANPFSENKNDYLIVGEFYDFTTAEVDNIVKIVMTILSNKVKIVRYILNGRIVKENYSYGYFLDNKKITVSETFKKGMLIFPWDKKKVMKKIFEFESWIDNDEFTIKI